MNFQETVTTTVQLDFYDDTSTKCFLRTNANSALLYIGKNNGWDSLTNSCGNWIIAISKEQAISLGDCLINFANGVMLNVVEQEPGEQLEWHFNVHGREDTACGVFQSKDDLLYKLSAIKSSIYYNGSNNLFIGPNNEMDLQQRMVVDGESYNELAYSLGRYLIQFGQTGNIRINCS
jgi:hypothetical protein